jgi:hypothetical protein
VLQYGGGWSCCFCLLRIICVGSLLAVEDALSYPFFIKIDQPNMLKKWGECAHLAPLLLEPPVLAFLFPKASVFQKNLEDKKKFISFPGSRKDMNVDV